MSETLNAADREALLRSVLDRLIPPDEWPGATGLETDHYVLVALKNQFLVDSNSIWAALETLNLSARARFAGKEFRHLSPSQQDELLIDWEKSATERSPFHLLVELAAEGYYADPGNGGNRNATSWAMLGYNPRRPDPLKSE